MSRVCARNNHSYTRLILALGIVRYPAAWGFMTSEYSCTRNIGRAIQYIYTCVKQSLFFKNERVVGAGLGSESHRIGVMRVHCDDLDLDEVDIWGEDHPMNAYPVLDGLKVGEYVAVFETEQANIPNLGSSLVPESWSLAANLRNTRKGWVRAFLGELCN